MVKETKFYDTLGVCINYAWLVLKTSLILIRALKSDLVFLSFRSLPLPPRLSSRLPIRRVLSSTTLVCVNPGDSE